MILYIVGLAVVTALLWAVLLMHDPATVVSGTGQRADGALSVTVNEQGWPTLMDAGGTIVHPEDLERGQ